MRAVPIWFRVAAAAAVLWMVMGCLAYVQEMTASPETIAAASDAGRIILTGRPPWSSAAFAVTVWGGLAGALLLLFGRAAAVPLLWAALAATILSSVWPLVLSGAAPLYSPAEWGFSLLILIVQGAIGWLALWARRMGWLA